MRARHRGVLLLGIKLGFVVLLCCFFSMRYLIGTEREWFKDTTSAQTIINDLKKSKYDPAIINSYDPLGRTGLFLAVARADLELVKAFLAAGADVNLPVADDVADTPLHLACYSGSFYGNIPIIDFLVNRYVSPFGVFLTDVSARNKRGETPLHHAVQISVIKDRQAVMLWLVMRGADINAQDDEGSTVFHIMVNNKDDAGIQMFFDTFGTLINPNIVKHVLNKKELMTPLQYAEFLGFRDIAARIKNNLQALQDKQGRERWEKSTLGVLLRHRVTGVGLAETWEDKNIVGQPANPEPNKDAASGAGMDIRVEGT